MKPIKPVIELLLIPPAIFCLLILGAFCILECLTRTAIGMAKEHFDG